MITSRAIARVSARMTSGPPEEAAALSERLAGPWTHLTHALMADYLRRPREPACSSTHREGIRLGLDAAAASTAAFDPAVRQGAIAILRRTNGNACSAPAETAQVLQAFASSGMVVQDPELRAAARLVLAATLPPEARFLIPALEERQSSVMNTWKYQNEGMEWDIGPNELVLDVGSGGWPFSRATHLADRHIGETTHRMETLVRDERPFVAVDLHRLPFGERAYDFVFCSHVLEHLDRPGDAIRELMRVGRRGYIEVPTRLSDIMLNFTRLQDHHRWHGLVLGGTLVLMEWDDRERRNLGSDNFFLALQSRFSNDFQSFFERNWDLFFAMYPWRDRIDFLVVNKQGRVVDQSN